MPFNNNIKWQLLLVALKLYGKIFIRNKFTVFFSLSAKWRSEQLNQLILITLLHDREWTKTLLLNNINRVWSKYLNKNILK